VDYIAEYASKRGFVPIDAIRARTQATRPAMLKVLGELGIVPIKRKLLIDGETKHVRFVTKFEEGKILAAIGLQTVKPDDWSPLRLFCRTLHISAERAQRMVREAGGEVREFICVLPTVNGGDTVRNWAHCAPTALLDKLGEEIRAERRTPSKEMPAGPVVYPVMAFAYLMREKMPDKSVKACKESLLRWCRRNRIFPIAYSIEGHSQACLNEREAARVAAHYRIKKPVGSPRPVVKLDTVAQVAATRRLLAHLVPTVRESVDLQSPRALEACGAILLRHDYRKSHAPILLDMAKQA
jgi:hypothetical protein